MGANDPPDMDAVGMKATEDARPIHRVYVDGFFMDKTDVTNAEFAKFVKATGYHDRRTQATCGGFPRRAAGKYGCRAWAWSVSGRVAFSQLILRVTTTEIVSPMVCKTAGVHL